MEYRRAGSRRPALGKVRVGSQRPALGRFACSWSYRALARHCFYSAGSSKDRRSIIDIDIIGVVVTWIPQSASKIETIKEKKIYLLVQAKNLINCLTHSL
jgi:hypothetical protein